MLEEPLDFTGCSSIQFFHSPPFPNSPPPPPPPPPLKTVIEAARGYLPLTVQSLCDLRDAMPRHWSPSASHPTPV